MLHVIFEYSVITNKPLFSVVKTFFCVLLGMISRPMYTGDGSCQVCAVCVSFEPELKWVQQFLSIQCHEVC